MEFVREFTRKTKNLPLSGLGSSLEIVPVGPSENTGTLLGVAIISPIIGLYYFGWGGYRHPIWERPHMKERVPGL